MSAGRRGLLLSSAFLGLVWWISPTKEARGMPGRLQPVPPAFQPAQPTDPNVGNHKLWQQYLTPDQIKKALGDYAPNDTDNNKMLEDLIRDEVMRKNPNADPKQMDATIKRLLADKELMDRLKDIAQKHANQRQLRPGEQPKLTPQDYAKLAQPDPNAPNRPNWPTGDPFKVPNDQPPRWEWDRNLFPFDPNEQPRDPVTKFPLHPDTGKPFDPKTGDPVDPKDPPPLPPPMPKVEPDPIDPMPKVVQKPGIPHPPPPPDPDRPFPKDNPLGERKETPEQAAKTKAVETATNLWERNVGPIDESPAVKRAIIDLVSDPEVMDSLTDDKGNSLFDVLQKEMGDGETFGDWLKNGDSNFTWPKLDWSFNWGKSDRNLDLPPSRSTERSRWPSFNRSGGSSGLDSLGSFNFGGMQVPWLLLLILLAIVVAVVVMLKWKTIFAGQPTMGLVSDGLGPWPIDPRAINTREDVVKAFEYLSVMICGPAARTWTHSTIAEELAVLARTHGETATKLARLYELARYAPLDEPLTRAELLEARRLVCDLAGVDEV